MGEVIKEPARRYPVSRRAFVARLAGLTGLTALAGVGLVNPRRALAQDIQDDTTDGIPIEASDSSGGPKVAGILEAALPNIPLGEILDGPRSGSSMLIKPANEPIVMDKVGPRGGAYAAIGGETEYFPTGQGRIIMRAEGGQKGSFGVAYGYPDAEEKGADVIGLDFTGGTVVLKRWVGGIGPSFLRERPIVYKLGDSRLTDIGIDISDGGRRIAGVLSNGNVTSEHIQLEKPIIAPGGKAQIVAWRTPDSDTNLIMVAGVKS